MTKSATLSERLNAIPFLSLPQTFQDAIMVARNLNVPYLWIDTFCIVQNSKQDWEKEAAAMVKVYCESLCTVAASSSDNWQRDCFVPRDTAKTLSCDLHWLDTNNGTVDEDVSLKSFHLCQLIPWTPVP